MGLLSSILRNGTDGRLTWWCPGCNGAHQIQHGPGSGQRWGWNGNAKKPNFTPSVLVRTYRYPSPYEPDSNPEHAEIRAAFETGGDGHEWMMRHPKWGRRCHSFVVDGQMQFLGDCTHALAGQTVPIPPWPRPDWSDA